MYIATRHSSASFVSPFSPYKCLEIGYTAAISASFFRLVVRWPQAKYSKPRLHLSIEYSCFSKPRPLFRSPTFILSMDISNAICRCDRTSGTQAASLPYTLSFVSLTTPTVTPNQYMHVRYVDQCDSIPRLQAPPPFGSNNKPTFYFRPAEPPLSPVVEPRPTIGQSQLLAISWCARC